MNFDFNFFFPCYYWHLISKQLFVSIDKTTVSLYGYAPKYIGTSNFGYDLSNFESLLAKRSLGIEKQRFSFLKRRKGKLKRRFVECETPFCFLSV